jgi:hypothetical protein
VRDIWTKLPAALDREAAALKERHKRAPETARRFLGVEAKLVRVMQKMLVPDMLARLTPPEPKSQVKTE